MSRLFWSIIPFLVFISACSPKTNEGAKPAMYTVSQVYDSYEDFLPRLETQDDETIYIYNFFATWCTQCRKELPHMSKLDRKYWNVPNVKVLFVNLDSDKRQRLLPEYLKKYDIRGEVVSLTDPRQEEWISRIHPGWNGSLPGTMYLKGKHKKFYSYPLTYPELERNIDFMRAK